MNLFGIGTGELVVILLIALLVLGPERLPEIVRLWARFTKTVGQFTRTWQQFNAQVNAELNRELNPPAKPKTQRPAPAQPAPAQPESEAASNTIAPPHLQEPAIASPASPDDDAAGQATEAGAPRPAMASPDESPDERV